MNFKNDNKFIELVAAHKAGLKLVRSHGHATSYRTLIQKQMNLQETLMREYGVSFVQLHGAMVSA